MLIDALFPCQIAFRSDAAREAVAQETVTGRGGPGGEGAEDGAEDTASVAKIFLSRQGAGARRVILECDLPGVARRLCAPEGAPLRDMLVSLVANRIRKGLGRRGLLGDASAAGRADRHLSGAVEAGAGAMLAAGTTLGGGAEQGTTSVVGAAALFKKAAAAKRGRDRRLQLVLAGVWARVAAAGLGLRLRLLAVAITVAARALLRVLASSPLVSPLRWLSRLILRGGRQQRAGATTRLPAPQRAAADDSHVHTSIQRDGEPSMADAATVRDDANGGNGHSGFTATVSTTPGGSDHAEKQF